MKRRYFIQASLAGIPGTMILPDMISKHKTTTKYYEDQPLAGESDVLVCGGGSAGCAAAISAARKGVSVQLLELNGSLGGALTIGLVNSILDSENKSGFIKEFEKVLDHRGGMYTNRVDPELSKLILEEMCISSGVRIRYHSRITGAVVDRNKRLTHVITESKAGREIWKAKTFIDCTGDGDLSVFAGCGFDIGDPSNGKTQSMSFNVYLAGVGPLDTLVPREYKTWAEQTYWLFNEIKRGGYEPSYKHPTFYMVYENLSVLMANHEYDINPLDPDQITAATIHARQEMNKMIEALRSLGGHWKNIHIVSTPGHIGVRECRRIHGRYTVTSKDLIEGARHDDAVCRATFNVDIHSTEPDKTKGIMTGGVKVKPYDIPVRALVAKDVDGLMMAGRNISGDFWAHGSYRVIGNIMPMGEAAGLISAKAVQTARLPHEVKWKEVI